MQPVFPTYDVLALLPAVRVVLDTVILPRSFAEPDLDSGTLQDAFPDLRAAELSVSLALAIATRRPTRVERLAEAFAIWSARRLSAPPSSGR